MAVRPLAGVGIVGVFLEALVVASLTVVETAVAVEVMAATLFLLASAFALRFLLALFALGLLLVLERAFLALLLGAVPSGILHLGSRFLRTLPGLGIRSHRRLLDDRGRIRRGAWRSGFRCLLYHLRSFHLHGKSFSRGAANPADNSLFLARLGGGFHLYCFFFIVRHVVLTPRKTQFGTGKIHIS